MGSSIRPALPFTGTSNVSSTSSVSTDTHATPPKGACIVNAAFSPGRNGSARRSILNVVSLTTGNWAACSPVTAGLRCWESKFGRCFRLLRSDFRELISVTITVNKRRELFFDCLRGDVIEIGANKNALLFLILRIERVDLDFYSTRFCNLLFSADTEARFCCEKRGRVASGESLSVDRGDVRAPANVHATDCRIVFKRRFAGDCRETVRVELRIALDRFDVLTVDIEARTDFGVGVETFSVRF